MAKQLLLPLSVLLDGLPTTVVPLVRFDGKKERVTWDGCQWDEVTLRYTGITRSQRGGIRGNGIKASAIARGLTVYHPAALQKRSTSSLHKLAWYKADIGRGVDSFGYIAGTP